MTRQTAGATSLDFDLTGRVAVVTGASSGIGAAIAKALAASGTRVVATGRNKERLQKVNSEIAAAGGEAVSIEAELTDANGVDHIINSALNYFGGLDILVLCAGIFIPATFADTTLEELDKQIDINLRSAFLLSKAALPCLKPGSSIIFRHLDHRKNRFCQYRRLCRVERRLGCINARHGG